MTKPIDRRTTHPLIAAACALLYASAPSAEPDGYLGFSQRVSVGWSFNVESAVVNYVAPNSPAHEAGIAVGDAIAEVDGCAIPGCGAYKARDLMEKNVGETLNLKMKRPNGEVYSAVLKAVPRPAPEPKQ